MRLLFVCSSLEPGRDGVGDYTRALAEECSRRGHRCALVALHDRHIAGAQENSAEHEDLPALRLGAGTPWSQRTAHARDFVARFQPEWISLQFVCYGFDEKGIVAGLPARLRTIVGARRLHLMMHELWSGGDPHSSLKTEIVGKIQRFFVLRLLRQLRPSVVQSNLPLHIALLRAAGFAASPLPLFGNIPLADLHGAESLPTWLQGHDRAFSVTDGGPVFSGVFFGSIYPEWNPEPLFSTLQRVAGEAGKTLLLLAAGRLGTFGEARWKRLSRDYSATIRLLNLGAQSPRRLSQLFQLTDFGIATAPWHLLGKSGSAAAMLDHGLPTIVFPDPTIGYRDTVIPAEWSGLVHRGDETLGAKLRTGLARIPPVPSLPRIATSFLESLAEETADRRTPGNTTFVSTPLR